MEGASMVSHNCSSKEIKRKMNTMKKALQNTASVCPGNHSNDDKSNYAKVVSALLLYLLFPFSLRE